MDTDKLGIFMEVLNFYVINIKTEMYLGLKIVLMSTGYVYWHTLHCQQSSCRTQHAFAFCETEKLLTLMFKFVLQ